MNEKKMIKKQLLKNAGLNFIAFTTVFAIFAVLIYSVVSGAIYGAAENKLLEQKESMKSIIYMPIVQSELTTIESGNIIEFNPDFQMSMNTEMNPNIIYITRNTNGEILTNTLTNSYKIENIEFNKNEIDKIYTIRLNEEYSYKGINYEIQDGNYMQLLVNIDSEEEVMNSFVKILVIASIIFIILSAVIGYSLAAITIRPIASSWKKQTEFVQNASHELRTPITIIQSIQELLLKKPNSKMVDNFEDVNATLKESKRLAKLIQDLMDLSISDSNQTKIKKEEIDVNQLIREVSSPYIEYAKTQNKTLALNLNYPKLVKIDKDKIQQLIIILLDNAIKYTQEKDEIEITTKEKEHKCMIEIKDTGIGIEKEDRKYIFDRFYRVDKARNKKTGGNGLGLAIAKSIVDGHNGTIKVEENLPKGTCIQIKLPKN